MLKQLNLVILLSNFFLSFVCCDLTLRGITIINPPFVTRENDKFEGYLVDLLDRIAAIGKFNYTLELVQKKSYQGTNKELADLVEELNSNNTDFILTAIPYTTVYDELDISIPFMTTQLSALVKKEDVSNMTKLEHLLEQRAVRYGVVMDGEVGRAMEWSEVSNLTRMVEHMDKFDKLKVSSIEKGVDRVLNHKYAFIQDSVANDYVSDRSRNCKLTVLSGGDLLTRNYSFAFKKGSPYVNKFNQAIELIKQSGQLEEWYYTYWNLLCNAGLGIRMARLSYMALFFLVYTVVLYIVVLTILMAYLYCVGRIFLIKWK